MLVLLPSLLVCLSLCHGMGSSSPDQCCDQKFKEEESIESFKKGTEESGKGEDEVLPLLPNPVTSEEDLLLETKSVLQDEKYLNGFLIEISVGILLVVVLCIICCIPLVIKWTWGGVSQDQADQEGQQLESQHQEAELPQGVFRPLSASTYQARSTRTSHPLPQRPDSPIPGGDATYRYRNSRRLTDTEHADQDDYLNSYFDYIQEGQYFGFQHFESLHQGLLRPYSALSYQPRSARNPHPLTRRPDSPHPGHARRMTTDIDDDDQDSHPSIGQFINFDLNFSQNHHEEPVLHQRIVHVHAHPFSARTYPSRIAYPPYPQGTHFTSPPYCPDPPPAYPGRDAAYPQLLAGTEDIIYDYLPTYDEAVGQF